jgi:hypothetical protein
VVHSPPRDAVWWVSFLPEADVDVFLTELVTVAQGAVELGNLAPLAVLLTQWRHSAEGYADPALLEILTTAPEGIWLCPGSVGPGVSPQDGAQRDALGAFTCNANSLIPRLPLAFRPG